MDYFDGVGGGVEQGSEQKKEREADLKLKEQPGANRTHFFLQLCC